MRGVQRALLLAGGAAAVALLRRELVIVRVRGDSMTPALESGGRVLVRRRPLESVRAGDVVVVEMGITGSDRPLPPEIVNRWLIKRAAAVPGEPVPGEVAGAAGDAVVPPGHLVVLGDNPESSFDSRAGGYVPGNRLLGVVVASLGPARRALLHMS